MNGGAILSSLTTHHSPLATLLLLLLIAPGCASMPPLFSFIKSEKFDRADAKNPASEILALWQPSEGPGQNGVPTRGFNGQIYFFTQAKPGPVVVDGKVRIYLFDDRGSVEQQGKPIGEFDYDPIGWNARAHQSSLGPGYAVFIPYPRSDFHQAACSLRVRFTPNVGPTIYSPTASVALSGPPVKSLHGDEMMFQSPAARQLSGLNLNGSRPPAGAGAFNAAQAGFPSATAADYAPAETGGLPLRSASRAPQRQNVVPVAGTEDDARLSLADDAQALDDSNGRSAPIPDQATAAHSGRIRLQSATAEAADPDDE
ncbi:MAG TPA: hypothetical protein VMR25_12990 [Planctomycetaceae bacterium]|jgi:hypothetical protein|nr:hypothetical protein [Planctomycetaceae bacterium]